LTALFRGRFRALTCVRELDPYIARRDPELGPLEPMPVLTPLPAEAVLFAYLGGEFRNLDSVVQALSLLRCKVRAFLRDDAAMHASFLASRGVHVFRDAPALATVVPQSTWVLSMAGHTTAHAALMGGRGQIVAPTHLETSMTAERLIKLGVAREYDPRGEPHEIADALAGIVADEGPLEAAASAAAAIADRHLGSGLERLITACREALA
jgi:hypothetical protein